MYQAFKCFFAFGFEFWYKYNVHWNHLHHPASPPGPQVTRTGGMRSPRILPKVKNSNLTFKTPAKRHEWKLFNEKSIPAHWKIMPEEGSRKNFREVGIHNIAFAQGKKKSDCLTKKCNFKIKPFLPLGIGHTTLKSHLHLTIRCPEIHPSTYETLSGWVQKSVRRHHQTSDASQDKEKKYRKLTHRCASLSAYCFAVISALMYCCYICITVKNISREIFMRYEFEYLTKSPDNI